jgi:hypothetical protein
MRNHRLQVGTVGVREMSADKPACGKAFVGHATFSDGSHIVMTPEQAEEIWNAAIAEKTARAVAMPTEESARKALHQAWLRLTELGWMQPCYAHRLGECDLIELGSSGIHRGAYNGEWPNGEWWLADDIDTINPALAKPGSVQSTLPQR